MSPAPCDVLIVEDDRDMLDVIKATLDGGGYRCRAAANGQRALEMIALVKPALVLLDMQMPVMNGWECARRLHATYGRAFPIVIMTGAKYAASRRDEVEADGMLTKPFAIDQLLRIVARYVAPHE